MALIDKASLLFVPSVVAEGKAFNVLPSGNRAPDSTDQNSGYDQTRADFDFDRGSNAAATRIDSNGVLQKYRENLLTESNNFSDSDWSNSGISLTSGQEDPFGSNNAWRYLMSGSISASYLYQNNKTINASAMVLSFWVKSNTGSNQTFRATANSGSQSSPDFTATTSWQRFSWFFISNAGNSNILLAYNQSTNVDLVIYAAQFEVGTIATDYLESTSVTGKAGVLVDLPRINYDANGENGSLLLEPSRQQLLQYSEYFSGWTKVDTTLTHNYGFSPEGVKNSTRVQFADSTAYMYIAPGGTSSGTYASSIYIKGTAGETIKFGKGGNIASGAMHTLNGDWQRIEHITTDVGLSVHISTYGGSTARDIEIYGCQLEPGSYKSSYIPNHGESGGVTRAADSCLGAGEASTFNSNNGVLFWEGSILSNTTIAGAIALIGAGSNRVQLYNSGTSLVVLIQVDGGSVFGASTSGTIDITSNHKYAVKWGLNNFAFWIDGVEYATDTSGATFSDNALTEFRFSDLSTNYLYANTKQAAVFNEALNDSELATLTTL